MANEPADGNGEEVPDAVREWLGAVAQERGVSEEELLAALLADGPPAAGGVDGRELDRVEERFEELIDDVRDRIVQVKRETDEKAPADHTHHDLRSSIDGLGDEVDALDARLEAVDERIETGFENYEEILTYLTETTDTLNRRLGRLASAVIELREHAGGAAREEVRRTALSHLTDTANRHGVETARCGDCRETVDLGLLVEPRCPHCDAAFTSLEPKSGFFRRSVLHTGSLPALEAPEESPAGDAALESIAEGAAPAEPPEPVEEPAPTGADEMAVEGDGAADLESIDGIGPTYARRLRAAGVDSLLSLALADPEQLSEAIDVSPSRVADWIADADART